MRSWIIHSSILILSSLFILSLPKIAIGSASKKSLYQRIGGKPVISKTIGDFVDRLAADQRLLADPRIKEAKDRINRNTLKSQLTDKVCQIAGGPCTFKGPILKDTPLNFRLSPSEWFVVIDDLNQALDHSKIPRPEQNEILSMILGLQVKN